MEFLKKKVRIETLGEYLKEVRSGLKVTKSEIATVTSISEIFLDSLEAGDFKNLPADVYVFGFLRELAKLYAMDPEILIGQYKKEKKILSQIQNNNLRNQGFWKKIFRNIIFTPKLLLFIFGFIFVSLSLLYVVWQVLSINQSPFLEINQPKDRSVIVGTFVRIKGKTQIGASLSVNEQNVFVDSDGNFNTQLGLAFGPKELIFESKNKFDRKIIKKINIIGQAPLVENNSLLELKLDFFGNTDISFVLDDGPNQPMSFQSGETKILKATKNILLSVSDAGVVQVSLNGRDLGFLGRAKESLNNIPFFAETDIIN